MRVQVKNYKNSISENSVKDAFQKLDIRRCAPLSTFVDEPLSIAMLVQVGKGSLKPSIAVETLGRNTRTSSVKATQIQVACSLGNSDEALKCIAGDGINNAEFKLSSESFRHGEFASIECTG